MFYIYMVKYHSVMRNELWYLQVMGWSRKQPFCMSNPDTERQMLHVLSLIWSLALYFHTCIFKLEYTQKTVRSLIFQEENRIQIMWIEGKRVKWNRKWRWRLRDKEGRAEEGA